MSTTHAITPRVAERVAFVLATPTEPPHVQARQMKSWLNIWVMRVDLTSKQRLTLRSLVAELDALADRLEADHMARAKARRVGWACRVRNWWRAA